MKNELELFKIAAIASPRDRIALTTSTRRHRDGCTPHRSDIVRTERLLYCDFVDPNADPRVYQEVEDIDKLKLVVNDFLEEHNAESKSPMPLVMFLDAIEHVLRIARILRQPQGNALLLGVGGSGRQSMSKMATYISGYELFQVEIAKGYGLISAF